MSKPTDEEKKERQEVFEQLEGIARSLVECLEKYKLDPSDENFQGLLDISEDIWGDDENNCTNCGSENIRETTDGKIISSRMTDEKIKYYRRVCDDCQHTVTIIR